MSTTTTPEAKIKASYEEIRTLLRQDIVGLDDTIQLLLTSIFSGGHCLLVGVPGLAKTLLISSMARLLDMDFSRIQFTPDLMPSDITGGEVIAEDKHSGERDFVFMKGPIFANVVLADEINRTPPKTQASLMQAMEEGQVSSLGKTFDLDPPFFVLATQNPIEQEGTYPLPTAQLDRFMFNVMVDYPDHADEMRIMRLTTRPQPSEVKPVLNKADVLEIVETVRRAPVSDDVVAYATTLARLSRPHDDEAPPLVKKYIAFGGGPRAAQSLVLGAKVIALMRGDSQPTHADIRTLVPPVFRHRMVENFMGATESQVMQRVLDDLMRAVPAPDWPPRETKKSGGLFSFFSKKS